MMSRGKIIGPLFLIGGIVGTGFAWTERQTEAQLGKEGAQAEAKVVGERIQRGRRGSRTYKLTVVYTTGEGGQVFQKEFTVPKTFYESNQPGATVSVRYIPSNPETSEIVGVGGSSNEHFFIAGIFAAIGLVTCLVSFRKPPPQAPVELTPVNPYQAT
jgi:hypothetical protein